MNLLLEIGADVLGWIAWGAGLLLAWLLLRVLMRWLVRPLDLRLSLEPAPSGQASTLVVLVHGMPGLGRFRGALDLVARAMPEADRLIVDYRGGWIRGYTSNADALEIADAIEQGIHSEFKRGQYERVILLGYSAGAALLRKALVWAYGQEEDRAAFGRRGKRDWVDRSERLVLLAGMNRGWTVSPRPRAMGWPTCWFIRAYHALARLLGIGRLLLSMHSGSPFIADTRVQWIRIARSDEVVQGRQPFPQVIQLIGNRDDLVSKEDGQDLDTAAGTVFRTIAQTGHKEIGSALGDAGTPAALERRRLIELAVLGRIDELEPDRVELREDREVTRLVYVMHGIRDYGDWTDKIRGEIERRCGDSGEKVAVFNAKYGYFPMARFLLYADRQRNVRDFMDRYTEHLAHYPNVRAVDYVGHSNGTYILASALQRYVTMRVRRVFFAGSVVPSDYPWAQLVEDGRVERVINVVATADWVVAYFPKLFEQIAGLFRISTSRSWLDLGGAGFNGFRDSGVAAAVDDLKFAVGEHGTGVAVAEPAKLNAIASYVVAGDHEGLLAFEGASAQNGKIGFSSNLSPLVWLALITLLFQIGLLAYVAAALLGHADIAGAIVAGYVALVLLLLYFV
ncbi:hypothetical protein V1318_11230 [Lysobacter sp. CCNWLW3]|uniref:hypothetical protein n=1 Tax=unclassified Lysobacter TaxID=2635362 RepID=UPI002FD4B941